MQDDVNAAVGAALVAAGERVVVRLDLGLGDRFVGYSAASSSVPAK